MAKERFFVDIGQRFDVDSDGQRKWHRVDIREGLFNDSQNVVICLKFTTFVVATTVPLCRMIASKLL